MLLPIFYEISSFYVLIANIDLSGKFLAQIFLFAFHPNALHICGCPYFQNISEWGASSHPNFCQLTTILSRQALHSWFFIMLYIDKPGQHDFTILKKLVLPDGSVLRAKYPGRPTRDCLFGDPIMDGKRYTCSSELWLIYLQGNFWSLACDVLFSSLWFILFWSAQC